MTVINTSGYRAVTTPVDDQSKTRQQEGVKKAGHHGHHGHSPAPAPAADPANPSLLDVMA